jgi:hypothetical protein
LKGPRDDGIANLSAVGLAIPAALDNSRPIATIAPDGSVSVDWAAAEAAAKEPLPGQSLWERSPVLASYE